MMAGMGFGPVLVTIFGVLSLLSCVPASDRERARALAAAVDPSRPFAESRFVESDGLRLHYRHWAPEGGSAGRILLLHGFGSSTFSFRFLVPDLLSAGWEVAAADIPPFGYSDKTGAVARSGYDRGRLLWAVPDALGWEGPVVLLGHSMGGLYITSMAERNPERVRGLVYLAGAVPVDGKAQAAAPFFARLFEGSLDSYLRSWSNVKAALRRFAGVDVPDAMVDGYAAPFQVPGGVRALLDWSKANARQAPVHPESLRTPALLVWGEEDGIVALRVGGKLATAIAGSRLVVLPGLGHLAHELQPEAVDPVLLGFLAELPKR